ncbi:hypothetical protein JB92DRAFT_2854444 [Gautieria morchelliformis]|nr:hypothetical protein JB92DRAFT_2854444 [Gautieria morchelliformis]
MSDPRFARLKTDPRFRKPHRKSHKVVVDDRFKSIFDDKATKHNEKVKNATVDKYGRKLSSSHKSDNLKRFYRLEQEEELPPESAVPDYARGEVLMDSSDEEDQHVHDSEEDDGEVVLGRDVIDASADEPEIDLDESQFAGLDALAEVNAAAENRDGNVPATSAGGEQTNRLAVVNLDWDHVRASHLFQIFSSVVSPSPSAPRRREKPMTIFSQGKVLKVQIYPSEFGRVRLERERKEGPPKELFKKSGLQDGDNGPYLAAHDDGKEYDEDALRRYQLERLRYYYAIVTCNTVEAAAHIYSELDGTELERSANMFDLSFVPDGMVFDNEVSDEATRAPSENQKGVEFVTDALRHSKVKLTWDDDDPERNKLTRRTLSRKEIEESDFKAYLASSGSSDEDSDVTTAPTMKRDKLRALLLGGSSEDNELLPEGWGNSFDKAGDMEITFAPGLSKEPDDARGEEETSLQRYLRKQKEKRKEKKAKSERVKDEKLTNQVDEFFGEDSEDGGQEVAPAAAGKQTAKPLSMGSETQKIKRVESTPAELELLVTSVEPEPKHFDMRSVVRAEKVGSKSRGRNRKKNIESRTNEDEAQEDFSINVKDDRFKALHEDHAFAIDPSNPHFKKTKSMSALLEERAKRRRNGAKAEVHAERQRGDGGSEPASLLRLVESVKRKSAMSGDKGGKRMKMR